MEKICEVCRELEKQIEMAAFTWECIQAEKDLYRHKIEGNCEDEIRKVA